MPRTKSCNFVLLLGTDPYVHVGFHMCVGRAIWQSCECDRSNIYNYISNVQCRCHGGAHC